MHIRPASSFRHISSAFARQNSALTLASSRPGAMPRFQGVLPAPKPMGGLVPKVSHQQMRSLFSLEGLFAPKLRPLEQLSLTKRVEVLDKEIGRVPNSASQAEEIAAVLEQASDDAMAFHKASQEIYRHPEKANTSLLFLQDSGDASRPTGAVLYSVDDKKIYALAVAPGEKGKGQGAYLLAASLKDIGDRAGASQTVTLDVAKDNHVAQQLYRSAGGVRQGGGDDFLSDLPGLVGDVYQTSHETFTFHLNSPPVMAFLNKILG